MSGSGQHGGDRHYRWECPFCGQLVEANKRHVHLPCDGVEPVDRPNGGIEQ